MKKEIETIIKHLDDKERGQEGPLSYKVREQVRKEAENGLYATLDEAEAMKWDSLPDFKKAYKFVKEDIGISEMTIKAILLAQEYLQSSVQNKREGIS